MNAGLIACLTDEYATNLTSVNLIPASRRARAVYIIVFVVLILAVSVGIPIQK